MKRINRFYRVKKKQKRKINLIQNLNLNLNRKKKSFHKDLKNCSQINSEIK